MRWTPWLALLLFPLQQPPAPTPAPSPPATSSDSRVWIGRYSEYENFLSTVEIERTESFSAGVTGGTMHAFFKPGGLAAEGALRSLRPGRHDGFFESYKSEAAAYRLDRLLELDMVPPTVERVYDRRMVTLQLLVHHTKMLKDVSAQNLRAADRVKWDYQVHRMWVFDDLVANIDENTSNLMFDPETNFIKVDCSRCFTDMLVQPFEIGKRFSQIDRPFFDRVKALDQATVKREIGAFVEGSAISALFWRRDAIVKAFEKLVRQKGEAQVFGP